MKTLRTIFIFAGLILIGAVGYYSDLYIHDRNALVSPSAAQAQPPPGRLKSPGHDRTVEAEFFLDEQPTIYFARIVSPNDPRVFSRIWDGAKAISNY